MASETDIVVIGAGAAGLAAGEALAKAGASFRILEAGARRGGRAWTDFDVFDGVAFDRGCHWLHQAADNPLRPLADAQGFRYDSGYSYEEYALYQDGRRLDERETRALERGVDAAFERLQALADGQPASDAIDPSDPAYALFDHYIGLDFSHPATHVAAADVKEDDDETDESDEENEEDDDEEDENYPVCDGLGALILTLGAAVPVTLNTAVRRVTRRSGGFRLATSEGEIDARAVIVTVSTSVLAAGGVTFDPDLPADVKAAIAACPVGCAEKIGLLFDAALEAVPPRLNIHAMSGAGAAQRPVSFTAHCGDPRLVAAMVAGAYAEALVAEGEDAVAEMVMDELVGVAGSAVRDRLVKHTVTRWRRDPQFLGSYSAMAPGQATARAVLAEPFDDRLFLAGEATAGDQLGTVHGARQSGLRAAARALAALRAA